MKKILIPAIAAILVLTGCSSAADTANRNNVVAAENFEIPRSIVGVNGITGDVLFEITGYCSIETPEAKSQLDVICLTDRESGAIEKTTLGLSDNVTFVSTQTGSTSTDLFQPRVIFRPETIIPDFDLSTSSGDAPLNNG